jgi:hypothetical protein
MGQTSTERSFCRKIFTELHNYRNGMLRKTKEDIFNSAGEIDGVIRIYELLLEESRGLSDHVMQECMKTESLLMFLYGKWNDMPVEMDCCLEEAVLQFLNELNESAA